MISSIISAISPNEKKTFFTNLYRSCYNIMKRTALRVTGGSVNFEDIAQDAQGNAGRGHPAGSSGSGSRERV